MKRIVIVFFAGLLGLSACRKQQTPEQSMADMPGMTGGGMSQETDSSGVPIDRAEAARLGIRFARATDRPITTSVRAVGVLKYAEPRQAYVNARVNGWVEKLYADYVGKRVTAGEPLLALYSPDLVSAQEEYLLARRLRDDTLAASARRRLTLWDIPPDQIDSLEARGTVARTLTLRAPRSGEITEKNVIAGQAVQAGTKDLVFVNRGDGRFVPREVRVGARGDSLVEIVQGVRAGDEVVASATYLLDSESNLAAAIQGLMLQMGMGINMGGMDTSRRRP